MIVFVDSENEVVILYGNEGVESYPFNNLNDIRDALSVREKLYYVTAAMEASPRDVLELIAGADLATAVVNEGGDPNKMYIRSTRKGPLQITDVGLKFKNEADCIQLSRVRPGVLESDEVQTLLDNGILEIVAEPVKKRIIKRHNKDQEDKKKTIAQKIQERKAQKQGGEINAQDMADRMFSGGTDVEVIDFTSELR